MFVIGETAMIIGTNKEQVIVPFMVIGGLSMCLTFTLGIVEIVKIGKRMSKVNWTQADIVAFKQEEKERRKAERAAKKQTLINIIISVGMSLFLLIGSISGKIVFKRSKSGVMLVIIGTAFLIWSIVSVVRYAKQLKAKRNSVSTVL
jgi:hypothetical protein